LGSIFFIGSFFGFFFAGFLCDSIGRKNTMLLGNILTMFNFVYTYVVKEYWELIIIRFMFGFVLTLTSPVSALMVTELTPKVIRGRAMVLL
jgi:MFS transporter, putative metabolite transport protein